MINKDNTVTVAELLAILANGRVTADMPITTFSERETGCVRGIVAVELYTAKDGSKALVIHSGAVVAWTGDIESAGEVFP